MLNNIIENANPSITFTELALCSVVSVLLGFILAFVYYKLYKDSSKNYILSLVLIPFAVQIVIILVNGNLGTGVAVAGAFTLVRFRSMPGTAKEISGIFSSMVIGLACGMGFLGIAVFLTLVICALFFIIEKTGFGARPEAERQLKITIPDNLDYNDIFDDIFDKYVKSYSLERVKTTNMGSMYELIYMVEMKKPNQEKEFIDELRCRNGNLTIILGRATVPVTNEL